MNREESPSIADRSGPTRTGRSLRPGAMLAAALALWLIFAFIFVVTYPLNTAGDAMNYVSMILHLKSNLIHASG